MARPWTILDRIDTDEGVLELRQRGERDFLITVGGVVLMNSMAHRTEVALGRIACRHLTTHPAPRVLIGGLGMGYTLRSVLDTLPDSARVTMAELNPVVAKWCKGPLASLTDSAITDPRVTIKITDVARLIRQCAVHGTIERFDAIVFDLYTGPRTGAHKSNDPLYGNSAIDATRAALKPGGIFAVWGEDYDAGFEQRLRSACFSVSTKRPGRGGPRHVVYVAALKNSRKQNHQPR